MNTAVDALQQSMATAIRRTGGVCTLSRQSGTYVPETDSYNDVVTVLGSGRATVGRFRHLDISAVQVQAGDVKIALLMDDPSIIAATGDIITVSGVAYRMFRELARPMLAGEFLGVQVIHCRE